MKTVRHLILAVIAAFSMVSCQNDGHIGWLYGVWRVAEFSVNGEVDNSEIVAQTTFSFQSNIVQVVTNTDQYGSAQSLFGTWKQDGDNFELNFHNSDSQTAPGTGMYAAPWWLGFSSKAPMMMKLSDRKGDHFTLTWTDDEGKVNVYKFRKTW